MPVFWKLFLLISSESHPFREFWFTEGARLIVHERKRERERNIPNVDDATCLLELTCVGGTVSLSLGDALLVCLLACFLTCMQKCDSRYTDQH